MISVVKLYNRQNELIKSGTSGYSDQDEFNNRLYTVQNEIIELLCDNYERNQKVKEALSNHVVSDEFTIAGNSFSKPDDYLRGFDLWLKRTDGTIFPATEININEVSMYSTSFVRKPSLEREQAYYYLRGDSYYTLPSLDGIEAELVYCKRPDEALIELTISSNQFGDYIVPTAIEDLDWPEQLFNLFLYSMLEKIGVENKEQLYREYGLLGIQVETEKIKTT